MTSVQLAAILVLVLPALGLVLYPLFRTRLAGRGEVALPVEPDRGLELREEKAGIYRAIKELEFDHEIGHVSEDDYRASRDRYEARAAQIVIALDALPPAPVDAPADGRGPVPDARATPRSWWRHPAALGGGACLLLALGVVIGIGAGRSKVSAPPPSRAGLPAAMQKGAPPPGAPALARPGDPPPAGTLGGMLQAARQSLNQGRYQEAIAGYQAVLKRDARNADALTHLGIIVAIGGHADAAIENFDKALSTSPDFPPAYFYRGQVLYHAKHDYAGAVRDWERFLALVPRGEEHDRVVGFIKEARDKQRAR